MSDLSSDSKSDNQAYYIDSKGVKHNLGIRDLTYLPTLELKSLAPKIDESVDRFGNMSFRSSFTVKVARPEQLIALGVDIAEVGGDWSVQGKPSNKITEEMDF